MNALETAFVGLTILLGAGAIVYSGIRLQKPKPAPGTANNTDGGAPIVVMPPANGDQAGGADGGSGGGDGGAV